MAALQVGNDVERVAIRRYIVKQTKPKLSTIERRVLEMLAIEGPLEIEDLASAAGICVEQIESAIQILVGIKFIEAHSVPE